MRRGFLLSLDALFALSLVLLGMSFFALRVAPDAAGASALYLGGRDLLASGGSDESGLLRRGWTVASSPLPDARIAVRAERFAYPRVCGLSMPPDAPCLNRSDGSIQPVMRSVWVGSG
ncbi:hypothetical protein HYV43_07295 [Candidatus Micrarchaeota archaeon]|nr:hypothetical protein [Candidatus Micrarchaeota archaeon]